MSPYLAVLKITAYSWTCIQVYLGRRGMEMLNWEMSIHNSTAIQTLSAPRKVPWGCVPCRAVCGETEHNLSLGFPRKIPSYWASVSAQPHASLTIFFPSHFPELWSSPSDHPHLDHSTVSQELSSFSLSAPPKCHPFQTPYQQQVLPSAFWSARRLQMCHQQIMPLHVWGFVIAVILLHTTLLKCLVG